MINHHIQRLGIVLISLFIVVSFTTCKKPTYNKLSEDEIAWMPEFDQEDILLFQSNFSSLTQAMRIRVKTRGYRREGEDIYN